MAYSSISRGKNRKFEALKRYILTYIIFLEKKPKKNLSLNDKPIPRAKECGGLHI